MQIPSNMLITRIKPGIYMSSWMLVWAIVSGCTALVQNFGGLVAARFFLGITEVGSFTFSKSNHILTALQAPFYPGATYMLSIFYTRKGSYSAAEHADKILTIRNRGRYPHRPPLLRPDPRHRLLRPHCSRRLRRHGWFKRHSRMEMAFHHVRMPKWPPTQPTTILTFS